MEMRKIRKLLSAVLMTAVLISGTAVPVFVEAADSAAESVAEEVKTEPRIGPKTLEDVARVYSFSIDDTAISLPASPGQMKAAGFGFDRYSEADIVPANTLAGVKLNHGAEAPDDQCLDAAVYGSRDQNVSITAAKVASVSIKKEQAEAMGILFKNGDGIALGDPVSKVRDLYGKPSEDTGNNEIRYQFTRDMYNAKLIKKSQVFYELFQVSYDGSGMITGITMTYLPGN